ncbi:vesicle transport protein [Entophlyctis helioformis]|nr:vesicle transport protein [Entophlyctis helioformis]
MWLTDTQKIGVGLTAFGVFFMLVGILFFFDRGFLSIGNVLFLSGLTLIIGVAKTLVFFSRPEKIRGTVCFFLGVVLVFVKWPFVGICCELFGFVNLFGDFLPVVVGFLRKVPLIGPLLNLPGISFVVDKLAGKALPV